MDAGYFTTELIDKTTTTMLKHIGWLTTFLLTNLLTTVAQGQECSVVGLDAEVYYHPSRSVLAADLDWDEVEGATQYQVSYYSINSGEIVEDPTSDTFYTVFDLFEDENYDWRVRAYCDDEWNEWQDWDGFFTTDITPPFVRAKNITLYLNANGIATIPADEVGDGSWDSSGTLELSTYPNQLNCNDIGDNNILLIGVDAAGNQSTANAVITVIDSYEPYLDVNNLSVTLSADGSAEVFTEDLIGEFGDNCSVASVNLNVSIFNCENLGDNIVTVTVIDQSGNTSSQEIIVTVEDVTPPEYVIQDAQLSLDENGMATLSPSDVISEATDECGGISVLLLQETFSCSDIGTNLQLVGISDASGNSELDFAYVEVVDELPPVVELNDIFVDLDEEGFASINFGDVDNGTFDNCGIQTIQLDETEFTCDHLGENVLNVTVTDNSGNQSMKEVVITVRDVTPPVFEVQDIEVYLDENGAAYMTDDFVVTLEDGCGSPSLFYSIEAYTCESIGSHLNLVASTDDSDNVVFDYVTVTVADNMGPVALINNIEVPLDENGMVSVSFDDIDAGSFDNCGIESTIMSQTEFSCENIGANTLQVTLTDVHGNPTSEEVEINVVDNLAPVALLNDITVILDDQGNGSITFEEINNGSYDNCGITTVFLSRNQFSCEDVGEHTISVELIDAAGNSIIQDVTVFVVLENNTITVNASLIPNNEMPINEDGEFEYEVNYSIESICEIELISTVSITVPNVELIESVDLFPIVTPDGFDVYIDGVFIRVTGTDPLSLFDLIKEHKGIPVENGQSIAIKNTSAPVYHFTFEDNQLVSATGPILELLLTVTDTEGNEKHASDAIINAFSTVVMDTQTLLLEPTIFPVPSSGAFNIGFGDLLTSESLQVNMYNLLGREVDRKTIKPEELNFNRPVQIGSTGLDPGYYIIRITGNDLDISKKVLKLR